MSHYVSNSEQKYSEREATFVAIRGTANAVINARAEADSLKVWEPSKGELQDNQVRTTTARRIEDIVSCFSTSQIGSLEFLSQPSFAVNYNVYGDLKREPVIGENTNSIGINVDWSVNDVNVRVIPGQLQKLVMHESLVAVGRNGIRSREEISKATGWSRQALQNLSADEANNLQYAINVACGGASKLTRLVKGMMLYLEVLKAGELTVKMRPLTHMNYTETDVAAAGRTSDRSYIYNSLPGAEMHELVLTCMASAYPRPGCVSNVSIPSDAPVNVMIARGTQVTTPLNRLLNPVMVMSSVCRYATDTDCGSQLHAALLIASSLSQNRYFECATLPKVVSYADMLMPAVTKTDSQSARPQVTQELVVSLGRLHQMVSFATVKDLATAAELSASKRVAADTHVLEYLSRHARVTRLMGMQLTGVPILEGTDELDYISGLTKEHLSAILGTSILEALWLCGHSASVCENGVFSALKRGKHDLTVGGGGIAVLHEEIREAGAVVTGFNLPQGQFFTEGVNLGRATPFKPPKRTRVKMPITHAHECEVSKGRTVVTRREGGITSKRSSLLSPPRVTRSRSSNGSVGSIAGRIVSFNPKLSSPPSYRTDSPDDPSEQLASLDGLFDEPEADRQSWQSVVEEATGMEVKATRLVPRDASLMSDDPTEVAIYDRAGVLLTDNLTVMAEKIYQIRGRGPVPTERLMRKIGAEMLEYDGYGRDSEEMVNILISRKMIGAWWERADMAKMLVERGVGTITYIPTESKMQKLLSGAGLKKESQIATSMGRAWVGDVHDLKRSDWPKVVNSIPMMDYLARYGVGEDTKGFGGLLRMTLVRWLSIHPDFEESNMLALVGWARGLSVSAITPVPGEVLPYFDDSFIEMEYANRSSSITVRAFDRADSKLLLLATMSGNRRW
ncbi:capsid protein [Cryphonectria nitschkei chrysovirus 1]|uniref:Capsid protein n=1 Tax=Cryphonectria nitschkei chrysovirus 1 TaxID=399394 RepID=C7EUC3_9VIRU|nr:capsid protein [Cryphonectria nitschkei chrysovirus 1]ACT79251.1 capsid protein [Cryphonectria nitschkei chrysovirus 1]